jgi:hypothetical protein
VARDWRRLHNEELRNLYASASMIRGPKQEGMMREGGTCNKYGKQKCIQNFGRKT